MIRLGNGWSARHKSVTLSWLLRESLDSRRVCAFMGFLGDFWRVLCTEGQQQPRVGVCGK